MARIDALTKSGSTASARAQGKGPTVLVVPARASDEAGWDAVVAGLVSHFEVVRMRTNLLSADLAGKPMADEVADVLAIAAVLDPPILLVGHASGAVVAFEAALAIPWEFAGLVAYASAEPLDLETYTGLPLPITLVEGELSPPERREQLVGFAAALPQARVVTLPGQADQAHLAAPDLLADVIREVANQLLR